ncbi:MAG: C40 family peptidase [Actinobacteria bacterium]|nr:C40 family peptidase [Actinomycetota bacterium]
MLCLLLTDIGLYFVGQTSAQNAADAAALAAVQQSFFLFNSGVEPELAAKDIAEANGASLKSIKILRGGEKVEVEVSVSPNSTILGKMGIMPGEIRERAAAEIDIAAVMESDLFWYLGDIENAELIKKLISSPGPELDGNISTMVVLLCMQHLGKPYVWGGNGPNYFDCSGLVCYVYAQIGIRLPRTTYTQVNTGRRVNIGDITPGDLVFFRNNAHVGIYVGGGLYIHAPRTGDVVKLSKLSGRRDVSACVRII